MTDIVERLRDRAKQHRADGWELMREGDPSLLESAASEIERLRSRVSKLEERLEIDHAYKLVDGKTQRIEIAPEDRDKQYDGIECRDETIKLLEVNAYRLRCALAAERAACANVAQAYGLQGDWDKDTADAIEHTIRNRDEPIAG